MQVAAVNRPTIAPLEMPDRFKTEVVYFMTPAGEPGVPKLGQGEYWIRLDQSREWLDSMVLEVVSPLDAASKAEIELSEDHETLLDWLVSNEVEHVRLEV